jgi:hypothetical protein
MNKRFEIVQVPGPAQLVYKFRVQPAIRIGKIKFSHMDETDFASITITGFSQDLWSMGEIGTMCDYLYVNGYERNHSNRTLYGPVSNILAFIKLFSKSIGGGTPAMIKSKFKFTKFQYNPATMSNKLIWLND